MSSDEIYATALQLVDADGVEQLSMRKLAAELEVNPMSLYHHVDGKTALLQHVCALAGSKLRLPADDGTPWQEQLRALAHAYRTLARAHPSLWNYTQLHPEIIPTEDNAWKILDRCLIAARVPVERLVHIRKTLFAFVSGFISAEATGSLALHGGSADPDEIFEAAIDLIVTGLAAVGGRHADGGQITHDQPADSRGLAR